MSARAVVFAYHNVGVRCLSVLLAHGVQVPLVVTHQDDAQENIWFGSVAGLAALHGIPVITPDDPNSAEVIARVRAERPEFVFSFYYRHMLGAALLDAPARGAYNMHGSLLPKYRGRVPTNWAVLHGERETGASLHRMVAKPDAGDLVAQESMPILPNDTAHEVFEKVTCAAERCLDRVLPDLIAGTAPQVPLDLASGSYYGRRRPEDGRVDWSQGAWQIHNLVRAVAPPYPGAFFEMEGIEVRLLRSHFLGEPARGESVRVYWEEGGCYADCADGGRFRITSLSIDGEAVDELSFTARFGSELRPG